MIQGLQTRIFISAKVQGFHNEQVDAMQGKMTCKDTVESYKRRAKRCLVATRARQPVACSTVASQQPCKLCDALRECRHASIQILKVQI